jgi:hypothetical protein
MRPPNTFLQSRQLTILDSEEEPPRQLPSEVRDRCIDLLSLMLRCVIEDKAAKEERANER